MRENPLKSRTFWSSFIFIWTGFGIFYLVSFHQHYLEIAGVSKRNSILQVFYDTGEGFREIESKRIQLARHQFDYRINLPVGLKSIRIDPTNGDAQTTLTQLKLKTQGSLSARSLLDEKPGAIHQIDTFEFSPSSQILRIVPPENAVDPYFVFQNLQPSESSQPNLSRLSYFIPVSLISAAVLTCILLAGLKSLGTLKEYRGNFISFNRLRKHYAKIWISLVVSLVFFWVQLLKHQNEFQLRFSLTSDQKSEWSVFTNDGIGVQPKTLIANGGLAPDERRKIHITFKKVEKPIELRIDPTNTTNASIQIQDIHFRRYAGKWQRLLPKSIETRDLRIQTSDDLVLTATSLSNDPSLILDLTQLNHTAGNRLWRFLILLLTQWLLTLLSLFLIHWIYETSLQYGKKVKDSNDGRVTIYTLSLFYFLSFLVILITFFPGGLCGDTAGNIYAALNGEISPKDPPLLQYGIMLLQRFTFSQGVILVLQLGLYTTGFFLTSLYFVQCKHPKLAWISALLFLSPGIFYLQTTIIKDALVASLWLNIFALSLLKTRSTQKSIRLMLTFLALLLTLVSVLSRDNTFLGLPALLYLIFQDECHQWFPSNKVAVPLVLAPLFIFFLIIGYVTMQFCNSLLLGDTETRDYQDDFFVHQVCTADLMSLSILNQHSGVTSKLSQKQKLYFDHLYTTGPIYWLDRSLLNQVFPHKNQIIREWKTTVLNNPVAYLKYRTRIFSLLFIGNERLETMFIGDADNLSALRGSLVFEGKTTLETFETPDWLKGNWLKRSYLRIIHLYFGSLSDYFFVLTAVGLGLIVFTKVKKLNAIYTRSAMALVILGVCYTLPNYFLVQHPETRYVYPVKVLILCFIPILLQSCANWLQQRSAQD